MKTDKTAPLQGWGIALLRVVTGTIFLLRGGQKLFVDGPGFAAGFFGPQLGIPMPLAIAVVVGLLELLCGSALVLGLFTRLVSLPLALGMSVDVLLVHLPNGFFVRNGGYEYALMRLAATVLLVLAGPGRVALDNTLAPRKRPRFSRLLR